MTVEITIDGVREVHLGVSNVEETPTFLKLSGNGLIKLIPLKEITEVNIKEGE